MRYVSLLKFSKILIVGATALLTSPWFTASAEDKQQSEPAVRLSKADLTPRTLSAFLALGRPGDSEWRHLRVEWLTDVVAARRKAAAEDKPIVICYTGGAGYNEPLGVC